MPENVNNGGTPTGFDVESTGTLIHPRTQYPRRCITITNPSSVGMYLAITNSPDPESPTNQAEVGKGIYLSPNGGSYEINEVNYTKAEIWAIHDDDGVQHRICVMSCSA